MPLRRSSRSFVIVLLLAAALLLYPLSFGPVYWLCSDGRGRIETERWYVDPLFELYAPMVWLTLEGPDSLRQTLDWYLGFWGAP